MKSTGQALNLKFVEHLFPPHGSLHGDGQGGGLHLTVLTVQTTATVSELLLSALA